MPYCIVSAIIIVVATKTITIERIWSFCHGILNAFFVAKASRCDGRWGIPSSNGIINEEEANDVIDFVSIIIVIIIIIIIFFVV